MQKNASDILLEVRRAAEKAAVSGILVPSADDHQSEYVPARWARRAWLSGFTGSAGEAVVTADAAALWTDGRYWIQAEAQLDPEHWQLVRQGRRGEPTIGDWLGARLTRGARVGVDPRTIAAQRMRELRSELARRGLELVALERNPVDEAWRDAPPLPAEPVRRHPIELAGRTSAQKLEDLRSAMRGRGADAHLVTSLDCVAWLFNLRGADVACNPVFLAYAVVTDEGAMVFTDTSRVGPEVRAEIAQSAELREYGDFESAVRALGARRWWVDEESASAWAAGLCAGEVVCAGRSWIVDAKAVKNEREIAGMRAAHLRDGAALTRFLRWLEGAVRDGKASELGAAERLRAMRAEDPRFIGESFETIAGYGPNGAIVHYRVSADSSLPIGRDACLILDSGGQYEDGTTDVTRTLHFGEPDASTRERFTRVLRAHIALATARFPLGARGVQLDAIARRPLWEVRLDYAHGTGHGVGAALSVHERPPNISTRKAAEDELRPGMIFSNEPGHYVGGLDGMRLENLELVREDGDGWMSLEALTLAPIQSSLIEPSLLSAQERGWVDAYHRRVRDALSSLLAGEDLAYLERATAPL